MNSPLRTYAIGFDDPSFDESSDAEDVARRLGAEHRVVTITSAKARAAMLECLDKLDEPYADGSAIPTWYLAQLARPDVTVLLSGEGGDEVFAGYDTYAAFKTARWARRVPRLLRNVVMRPLAELLPVSHRKLSLEFKLKRFLGGLDLPLEEAHLWWRLVLGEAAKRSLYDAGAMRDASLEPSIRHFLRAADESGAQEPLARLQAIDSSVFLPDDLMVKNDRMTMAHGMEARVPFTDVELAEFLAKVPSRVKYPAGDRKRLLKRAFAGALPPRTARKKKIGLEMPYSRWFAGEWSGLLRTVLSPDRVAATGLLAPAGAGRLVDEHLARKADHGRALWALIQYVLWHEKAIQNRRDSDV